MGYNYEFHKKSILTRLFNTVIYLLAIFGLLVLIRAATDGSNIKEVIKLNTLNLIRELWKLF